MENLEFAKEGNKYVAEFELTEPSVIQVDREEGGSSISIDMRIDASMEWGEVRLPYRLAKMSEVFTLTSEVYPVSVRLTSWIPVISSGKKA